MSKTFETKTVDQRVHLGLYMGAFLNESKTQCPICGSKEAWSQRSFSAAPQVWLEGDRRLITLRFFVCACCGLVLPFLPVKAGGFLAEKGYGNPGDPETKKESM